MVKHRTQQERFMVALLARGETQIFGQRTTKYLVFTRRGGGYYYVGRGGSMRIGAVASRTKPVTDKLKRELLGMTEQSVIPVKPKRVGVAL